LHHLTTILSFVCAVLALAGAGYYVLCLFSAWSYLRDRGKIAANGFSPGVSILKSLRGVDPNMYEAFRSHCMQDYADYEIIFGVSDAHDEAIGLVEKLKVEFPQRRIQLVMAEMSLGANGKVSTLAQMLPHASFEYLVVNDSDIKVDRDYLQRIMAPLANARAGMVTCLYRGIPANSVGSRMESLGISSDFIPGVLTSRLLEGVKFGLGATLAFSRTVLEQSGGFEALVDYLADDYELGARVAASGREVAISEAVVDTDVPRYSFREFIQHQLRWARAVRDSRKLGYLGLGVNYALPWAILALLFSGGERWGWMLLGTALILRFAVAVMVGRLVLKDRTILPWMWLIPIRDVIALSIWMASFAGHTVIWRGMKFRLKGGKLKRA
jgi:ceramide glucosyltransferase